MMEYSAWWPGAVSHFVGHPLEDLAVEMLAHGLSLRDMFKRLSRRRAGFHLHQQQKIPNRPAKPCDLWGWIMALASIYTCEIPRSGLISIAILLLGTLTHQDPRLRGSDRH